MKIHYKTHYILQQTRTKFVAMKHSMFNMGMMNNQEIDMEQWFMSYVTVESTTVGEYH